ncbi:Sodium pump decarboxylase, gamma subunit [Rhodobacterales bacterium HTCC2150]|nr:Sodium pump decarboxylase, gamma subunit [Rhodobacterales bacterium HTCC2150] [Rhodobacteraceae bacterium HTCC2150]
MSHRLSGIAAQLYEGIKDTPILSPHGHCDPSWFATDQAFADPAQLLVIPDHYVFRMLYSQGIPLEKLGIGGVAYDPRAVFQIFADNWHLFLGTPSRVWIEFVLYQTLGVDILTPETANTVYDQIAAKLNLPEYRPRALYKRFGIEALATTDSALDDLSHHSTSIDADWGGKIVPTFRPDGVLDPNDPQFSANIEKLAEVSGQDTNSLEGYLTALRQRRMFFKSLGSTATDHAIEVVHTEWIEKADLEPLFQRVKSNPTPDEAARFYGHMLIEMAQMSLDDGLVMQLHAGSRRNTNAAILDRFGRDMGADIPVATEWVRGLDALLNRVGNDPRLTLILFTLDEATYARELAPMVGHWPCLRLGPPWWFHDSAAGIARYFDNVVETAGYYNLAGFNDDTRAFLSIPARHDLWRRGVAAHLALMVNKRYFGIRDAEILADQLTIGLARKTYRMEP